MQSLGGVHTRNHRRTVDGVSRAYILIHHVVVAG